MYASATTVYLYFFLSCSHYSFFYFGKDIKFNLPNYFFCVFLQKIAQVMKVTIELNAMKFYAYHGISLQERIVGNYFSVNVSYICPHGKACFSDDLNDTISYA